MLCPISALKNYTQKGATFQMNKKEIIRDDYIRVKMSKEEKELFTKYAKSLGIAPGRLMRNIAMMEAEKNALSKGIEKAVIESYKKYLEVTKQYDILERIKED